MLAVPGQLSIGAGASLLQLTSHVVRHLLHILLTSDLKERVQNKAGNYLPYDTQGGGHRGESHFYSPRTEVKILEMTSGAQRDETSRKISLLS